ncbi:MAG: hypothetical protein R3B13_31265 [Polyangiaceae bacterium]
MVFAEGANFRFVVEGGIVKFRLWRREDLDSAQGAKLAEETVAEFENVSRLPEDEASVLIMDIREGPIVCGPMTQVAVGRMLAAWGRTHRPLAVLCSDAPIQSLQYRRLVSQHVSRGSVFVSEVELQAWLRKRGAMLEEGR